MTFLSFMSLCRLSPAFNEIISYRSQVKGKTVSFKHKKAQAKKQIRPKTYSSTCLNNARLFQEMNFEIIVYRLYCFTLLASYHVFTYSL